MIRVLIVYKDMLKVYKHDREMKIIKNNHLNLKRSNTTIYYAKSLV